MNLSKYLILCLLLCSFLGCKESKLSTCECPEYSIFEAKTDSVIFLEKCGEICERIKTNME